MASLNHILMSSLFESSIGIDLYIKQSSKWLGHVCDTLSNAVIPRFLSIGLHEAWYSLPRYK